MITSCTSAPLYTTHPLLLPYSSVGCLPCGMIYKRYCLRTFADWKSLIDKPLPAAICAPIDTS